MLYYMNWLTYEFWTRTGRLGVWSLPWRCHILSIPLTTGRGTGTETCGLDYVFPPDDLCSRPEALFLYICMHSLYDLWYRTYIYIQQECYSVLVKLHPITFFRTVFLGCARFLGWIPLFVFFGVPIVSWSLINSLIQGWVWLSVFVWNNHLILDIWCSAISHLPGCFCPWTFFRISDSTWYHRNPFMSYLVTRLGYFAGEFQPLQLIVLSAFGVVD